MRNVTHGVRASISGSFLEPPEGSGVRRPSCSNHREKQTDIIPVSTDIDSLFL